MNSKSAYSLIDFGDGRKLESLGGYVVDRPSPAAGEARRAVAGQWRQADAVFDQAQRKWKFATPWPTDLAVDCDGFQMPLRSTPYGHIGLFPEQTENWRWLRSQTCDPTSPLALNLFGYTGASTMALASAGYQVAHVDAAKPNVEAARRAATANGHPEWPIRYLVDDAAKFAARERRRGRSYHTIVLDPPAYGHSPKGVAWRLERDLWPLLQDCLNLLDPTGFRLLITGHSPQVDASEVIAFIKDSPLMRNQSFTDRDHKSGVRIDAGRSQLVDQSGRSLDAGFFVRVSTA